MSSNLKTIVAVVVLSVLPACIAPQEDDAEGEAASDLSGRPSLQTTQAQPQVYVLWSQDGKIAGPFDTTRNDPNGPVRTQLTVGRPTLVQIEPNRLAFPWDGRFRYEPEIVNMHVSFNHDGTFKPLKLVDNFPGPAAFRSPTFRIPAGVTSMTVFFEGMARVDPRDARMVEGAHFETVSTRGLLKIYSRVVRHRDGSLWIHAWDSNQAQNFDFAVAR